MSGSRPLAVIACGALAAPLRRAAASAGRPVEVHTLSALLHDRPAECFGRTVVAELGLEVHPELVADYFGHYERVVWLTESDDGALEEKARAIATRLGLAFEKLPVGSERLEGTLAALWRGER
jgi:hypothetical protein